MDEPGQPPLNKKKKTKEGVAAAQKDSVNEQDNDKKQQKNAEEVNSREAGAKSAAKTSGKADGRFDRFKLFDKVMQKSLEKYVEIARWVSFSLSFCLLHTTILLFLRPNSSLCRRSAFAAFYLLIQWLQFRSASKSLSSIYDVLATPHQSSVAKVKKLLLDKTYQTYQYIKDDLSRVLLCWQFRQIYQDVSSTLREEPREN